MESCTGTVHDVQQPSEGSSSAQGTTPSKKFDLKHLINTINYIHFLDGTITACFRHKRYDTSLSVLAKPQPCTDRNLVCNWENTSDLQTRLRAHEFQHLLVNDGQKALLVEPESIDISNDSLRFALPDECQELNSRRSRRHACKDINAELIQNGSSFKGALIEFSATSLLIRVAAAPPQTFQWLNPKSSVTLVLSHAGDTIFSTECGIFKQSCGQKMRSIVLTPKSDRIFKFKPKKYRSTRQRLTPSPNINFKHPLTGKWIDLDVTDLSGSGLSVTENASESCLIPGLVISDLALAFANSDSLKCKAQVIYRIPSDDLEQKTVRCGIAFLDMKIQDQTRLLAILYQADNKRSYLSNRIDLDALWKFFFDSGFIYPEKYLHLKSNKSAFKKTYQTLYEKKPNIARHFVYQDNGNILAHMSMIRFYRNSWLIHHHAAQKMQASKGGLVVLSQISRYVNEAHRLYSSHLDFVFGYFRPENRFPRRYFGGAAEYINDPKACSIDSFAYFHFKKSFGTQCDLSTPLSIQRTTNEDLEELNRFLEHASGGLMAAALNLEPGCDNDEDLVNEYASVGLHKERHEFSLKINNFLKAVAIVNISDTGLNMSDINNSIKMIVLDPEGLNRNLVYFFLSMICVKLSLNELPVLVYPHSFAKECQINYEKIYNLWILNMLHLDEYFDFCKRVLSVH
ncbi:MAG: pilus assembly protein PilZ [Syntrophotaleaceae bacterium]